jgi:hypothetical protein
MRWLIFGLALIIAAVAFRMLPRYEMGAAANAGPFELDKWTGAVRACAPDKCTPWVGGAGPPS